MGFAKLTRKGVDVSIKSADELRNLFESSIDAWNERRLDDYFAGFARDVVYHGSGGLELRGVDALQEHYGRFLVAFPDLLITADIVVVDFAAMRVASMQTEAGTHTGAFVTPAGTLPPTGRTLSMTGAMFTRVGDKGSIVEAFELVDRMSITEQLLGPAR